MMVLLLAFVVLPTATIGSENDKEDSPVVKVTYLLDSLSEATIVIDDKKAARSEISNGRCFEPFHHSSAPARLQKYHRRAIFHYKKEILRDMREVLALPASSRATFTVAKEGSPVLVFAPYAVMRKRKGGRLIATITCSDESREQILWQAELTATRHGRMIRWPDDVSVALPRWCHKVALDARLPEDPNARTSPSEVWMLWGVPRVEQRVPAATMPPYNVLFIVVDALRSDVVGVHRTQFDSVSPAIDELENKGVTFPKGFSNGNTTLLSMNTMLLGGHPRALGFLTLWWAGKDRRPLFYQRKPPYLLLQLHKAGYVTYGATHNHLYFPGYRFAVDPGFDILQDSGKDTEDHPILTRRAIDFMRRHRNHRFLAQVNLIGPHQPYTPPRECLEKAREALKGKRTIFDERYVGEACWADVHVGKLVASLDELELAHNTLVVLTADHGEVMDKAHDCFSAKEGSRCRYLHGLTLYDEEINVPIIFSLPGVLKEGLVGTFAAQHVDIVPTILDLLGLAIDQRMTGRSLTPALLAGKVMAEVPVYAERWLARAYRLGGYKLIEHTRKDDICPNVAKKVCKQGHWTELYDVENDPHERHEISGKHPDIVRDYRNRIKLLKLQFHKLAGSMDPNP
jgi:arylsulfatase A-like enzyme